MATAHAPQPPQPQPVQSKGPQTTADGREIMSQGRMTAFRETYDTVRDVLMGKGTSDHPWSIVYHSRNEDGARAVADTLEATVVKGGSEQMQKLMGEMAKTPDGLLAYSAIMANVAEVAPERMVGITLLTTDGEGGKEAVADMWSEMSKHTDSSLRLSSFLEASTRTQTAARGVAELFEGMTEPDADSWNSSTQFSKTMQRTTETVGGSRRINQTFQNMMELDGGARNFARTLNRMGRSQEGARNTGEMLLNMSFDKEGANNLGRMLTRATESRGGARDMLDAFNRMAETDPGKRQVARLLARMGDSGQTAKLLANFAKDGHNAGALADLFGNLNSNRGSQTMLTHTMQGLQDNHRAQAAMQQFNGRIAANAVLQAEVEKTWSAAVPLSAPVAEAMPVLESGYEAKKQFEFKLNQNANANPDDPTRMVTGNANAGGSETGGDGEKRDTKVGYVQSESDPIEMENQRRRHLQAGDLGTLSDIWRNDIAKPREADRPERELSEQAQSSQNSGWQQDRERDDRGPGTFRPGDVYSEDTLRMARICGDCGYRTNSLGVCPRCIFMNKG